MLLAPAADRPRRRPARHRCHPPRAVRLGPRSPACLDAPRPKGTRPRRESRGRRAQPLARHRPRAPSATSSAAIPTRSTSPASPAPRSRASPNRPRTASSRRCSGCWSAGCPGILIYKAVNTADSMVGHKTERYLEFGWASATLRRSAQLDPGPPDRAADRRRRVPRPRRRPRTGLVDRPARRPQARFAQCRLAGGRFRRRSRVSPRRPADL